jgi:hypothetical protein
MAQVATQTVTNSPSNAPAIIIINGRTYRLATAHHTYQSNAHKNPKGSLFDGGCNGGRAGDDVLILDEHSFVKLTLLELVKTLLKTSPSAQLLA